MVVFSARTRAFRGFRDWNICYERVFEYGEALNVLRAERPRRILDVAGDISLFGCFVAEELRCPVDIVDMSDLAYCARLSSRLAPEVRELVTLIPRTMAEELPRGRRYDAIYCVSSIEHFDGDADLRFVESAGDLLEEGGVLVLTAPFTNARETQRKYSDRTYYDAHGEQQTDPRFYMRYYSRDAIDELVRRSGLQLVRLTFAGEVVNFCEPVFQFGTAPAPPGPATRVRSALARAIGVLSPIYPLLFMRISDDPRSFTCGPRRETPCNPDTFLLVLRKSPHGEPVQA